MKKMLFIMPVALVSLFALTAPAKASLPVETTMLAIDSNTLVMKPNTDIMVTYANLSAEEKVNLWEEINGGTYTPTVHYSNSVSGDCPAGTHKGDANGNTNCCCIPDAL